MKKYISRLLALLAVTLIVTACPYSSTVPLNEAQEAIYTELLGKWVKESELDSENPKYYMFAKLDKHHYNVDEYEWNSTDEKYDKTTYITHITKIGDVVFLNLEKDETYYFYKIEIIGGEKFILYEVTDNIDEKFTQSDDMYKFFEQYKHLSFFYNKDEVTYIKE